LANINFNKEHELSFPCFGNLSYGDTSLYNNAVVYNPAYGLVGKEVKFTIMTKDNNHHPCQKGGSKITKPKTGGDIVVKVEDNEDGSYSASFEIFYYCNTSLFPFL